MYVSKYSKGEEPVRRVFLNTKRGKGVFSIALCCNREMRQKVGPCHLCLTHFLEEFLSNRNHPTAALNEKVARKLILVKELWSFDLSDVCFILHNCLCSLINDVA